MILDQYIFLEENRTGVNYLMNKSLSLLRKYKAYTRSKESNLQQVPRLERRT
nr:MAG TPA: hypothetical protein [Caudoviricetes sp.]